MSEGTVVKVGLKELIEQFNSGIEQAENLCCISRSSRLQLEQSLALDSMLTNATKLKHQAINRKDEDSANLFLGFACVIGAVRSELLMYILIKRDMPNEGWGQYVAARMAYADAIRAHKGFEHCEHRLETLVQLEETLFPPQVFMSAGFVSDGLNCSICGEPYSKCEHLRGKPYMGEFCEVVHRNPRADHVSIVKTPADRRCRVISLKTRDGHRDKMTWETAPYKEGEQYVEDEGLEISGCFLSLERYPYLVSTKEILESHLIS